MKQRYFYRNFGFPLLEKAVAYIIKATIVITILEILIVKFLM